MGVLSHLTTINQKNLKSSIAPYCPNICIIRYFASMRYTAIFFSLIFVLMASCYEPQRACKDYKEGEFSFTTAINGKEATTLFTRYNTIEIDYFNGKTDTSSIRWINECEYVVKKMNPTSRNEEKAIHMKILSTTDSSYTFEYGIVGSTNKSIGTAIKLN